MGRGLGVGGEVFPCSSGCPEERSNSELLHHVLASLVVPLTLQTHFVIESIGKKKKKKGPREKVFQPSLLMQDVNCLKKSK